MKVLLEMRGTAAGNEPKDEDQLTLLCKH